MRMIGLLALALATPAIAQDAALDVVDGYPLEAKYTDNSDNFPKVGWDDEMAITPAPNVLLDARGRVLTAQGLKLYVGETYIFRVDENGFMTDIRMVSPDVELRSGEIRVRLESMGGNTRFTILNMGPSAYNYRLGTAHSAVQLGQPAESPRVRTCTLIPNVSAFELWPTSLDAVILGPFYPAPDGAMTCR